MSRVRCNHCLGIYDLGTVEVKARYADATVFTTPCCGRTVDDRQWKGTPDFRRVERLTDRPVQMMSDGTVMYPQ